MIKPRKPLVEYVDFIDPGRTFTGLKVYPVRQGMCKLDGNQISLWLEFPQSMTRGQDLVVPEGRIYLTGELWTTEELYELDKLYERYPAVHDAPLTSPITTRPTNMCTHVSSGSSARKEAYRADELVKDIEKAKDAPKRWNPETESWERPRRKDSPWDVARKKMDLVRATDNQRRVYQSRPDAGELSKGAGAFPGISCGVYLKKEGTLSTQPQEPQGPLAFLQPGNNAVLGTWSAEPALAKRVASNY